MVYISEGRIVQQRSWLRIIPDLFWGVVNAVSLFVQTLIQPNLSRSGQSYTPPGRGSSWRDPPGPPKRRMGRIQSSLDCSSAPMPGG